MHKGAFAVLAVGFLAACNSTQYYHNPTKTISEYTADYEECRKIAYIDNRDVQLAGLSGLNSSNLGGTGTGIFQSDGQNNDQLDRQNLNFQKCMFVNGYASYWVEGEVNDEIRALPPEEALNARAKLGTAEEPVGELEPYPPHWRLPNNG